MTTFLVCGKGCGKEEYVEGTVPQPCPLCGSARYAENERGEPMVIWSDIGDPNNWAPPER